jgi:hypothetical protein
MSGPAPVGEMICTSLGEAVVLATSFMRFISKRLPLSLVCKQKTILHFAAAFGATRTKPYTTLSS